MVSESELGECFAEQANQLHLECATVQLFRLLSGELMHRFALYELSLHAVQRSELMVTGLQTEHFAAYGKELRDEIFKMWCERDQ